MFSVAIVAKPCVQKEKKNLFKRGALNSTFLLHVMYICTDTRCLTLQQRQYFHMVPLCTIFMILHTVDKCIKR